MKKPIPKISDLVRLAGNVNESYEKDSLNELLNQPPHASWVKAHPMAKAKDDNGNTIAARYLPIDKVEFLLTYIFQNWRVEVLREQVMFNSIAVTVRLHVQNPLTSEWTYQDGLGAMNVQTDAGKSDADLAAIKAAAVQMALPSAKSYAIKDAAEHFGAIFGRDLNRRDIVQFSGAHTKEEKVEPTMSERLAPNQEMLTQYYGRGIRVQQDIKGALNIDSPSTNYPPAPLFEPNELGFGESTETELNNL